MEQAKDANFFLTDQRRAKDNIIKDPYHLYTVIGLGFWSTQMEWIYVIYILVKKNKTRNFNTLPQDGVYILIMLSLLHQVLNCFVTKA